MVLQNIHPPVSQSKQRAFRELGARIIVHYAQESASNFSLSFSLFLFFRPPSDRRIVLRDTRRCLRRFTH